MNTNDFFGSTAAVQGRVRGFPLPFDLPDKTSGPPANFRQILRDTRLAPQFAHDREAWLLHRCGQCKPNSAGISVTPCQAPFPMKATQRVGVPERIRTSDLRFRKPLLYPAELRGRRALPSKKRRSLGALSAMLDPPMVAEHPGFLPVGQAHTTVVHHHIVGKQGTAR